MKKYLILPLIVLFGVLQSCNKDEISDITQERELQAVVTPQAAGDPVYNFSELQVISGISNTINSNRFSITKSHLTYLVGSSTDNIVVVNTSDGLIKKYTYPGGVATSGTYAVDNEEENIYIVIGKVLSKFKFSNSAVSVVAKGLGTIYSVKSLGAGSLALTVDTLGGSLVRINSSGTKSILAQNLGFPGSLTFYNNEYFVASRNIINASVVKIDATSKVTTIINNLTAIGKITVDNFGTLIVGVQKTINSYGYRTYELYTSTGTFLTPLLDNTGKQIIGSRILSGSPQLEVPSELFIDPFNNLLFYHSVQSPQSQTPIYPLAEAVWKVRLIKAP